MCDLVKYEKLIINQEEFNMTDLCIGIYTAEIIVKGWTEKQKLIIHI